MPHCRTISIHALLAESDEPFCLDDVFQIVHFYPRSPCGERRMRRCTVAGSCHFYPRSPCGERLATGRIKPGSGTISIHALLAESDRPRAVAYRVQLDFYPRSPCGERPKHCLTLSSTFPFLSTLSLRRATEKVLVLVAVMLVISIHALLAESDR